MKKLAILLVVVLAMLGLGRPALAVLPVTTGLIYQLDATDVANIAYDGSGNMLSWTTSQGSAVGFSMVPGTGTGMTPPTYQATGGGNSNLPNVKFVASSGAAQSLVQNAGGSTIPLCVFIMENTDSPPGNGVGGIWGKQGSDQGIRFWNDNGPGGGYGPPNTHQLVNIAITGGDPNRPDYGLNTQGDNGQLPNTENYYWSDTSVFDGHQTWTNMNWGTLGGYCYNNGWFGRGTTFQTTALGNYYQAPGRSWSGQIGEVLAYDRYLTTEERQQVQTYLANKWLGPGWPNYLSGDFNLDGEVGPEDFGILKDGFGLDGLPFGNHQSWTLGDANDDGEIGPEDFGLLKDNFGLDGGPTGTYPLANVPEPATLAMLALALPMLLKRRAKA
ncbi:MAG: PEP-CTERM sorting domain-containing protein [Planctomycetota bacterium]|nr:PEP-CTERM sorting domain-containing protein [Planctomycetota bacterium]